MNDTVDLMMKTISNTVCNTALEKSFGEGITEEAAEALYSLSLHHDLAHIVGYSLEKNGIKLNKELEAKFQKQVFFAIDRYEKMEHEYRKICDALEKAKIPFLPLKGAILKRYYDESWMRTSCDIDFLVKEDDLALAQTVFENDLEYRYTGKSWHDIKFDSKNGVHVELHFELLESGRIGKAEEVLYRIWEHSSLCDDCAYKYETDDEMFYYYHVAHMAKHIENGGCGIRPFIDLWILNNKIEFDAVKRRELLENGGLLRFAETAEKLSRIWLESEAHDALTLSLERFILRSGTYGDLANKVAIHQSRRGGRGKYLLKRIWMPRDLLSYRYPVLKKHGWLLPLCEVRRWFFLVFGGKLKRGLSEMTLNSNISEEEVCKISAMMSELGLQ